jgi:hypothetical protein
VTSLVDGFLVNPGLHQGVVYFRNGGLVKLGALLSSLALVVVIAVLGLLLVRRRQQAATAETPDLARTDSPRLTGAELERSLLIAGVALGLAPISFAACVFVVVLASVWRRAGWVRPAVVGTLLVTVTPIFVALGMSTTVDRVAVAATFALLISVVRLSLATARVARA